MTIPYDHMIFTLFLRWPVFTKFLTFSSLGVVPFSLWGDQWPGLVFVMTSYVIYIRYHSGMTSEKCFSACTQHLGEYPIYTLYGVLCELAQLLPLQTRQLMLQVSIQQVHAFSCMSWEQHWIGFPFLSENLSIILFFVTSPFSFVAPRPQYSLGCFSLGWIFVVAFALFRYGTTVQLSLFFSPYFMINLLIPNYGP